MVLDLVSGVYTISLKCSNHLDFTSFSFVRRVPLLSFNVQFVLIYLRKVLLLCHTLLKYFIHWLLFLLQTTLSSSFICSFLYLCIISCYINAAVFLWPSLILIHLSYFLMFSLHQRFALIHSWFDLFSWTKGVLSCFIVYVLKVIPLLFYTLFLVVSEGAEYVSQFSWKSLLCFWYFLAYRTRIFF